MIDATLSLINRVRDTNQIRARYINLRERTRTAGARVTPVKEYPGHVNSRWGREGYRKSALRNFRRNLSVEGRSNRGWRIKNHVGRTMQFKYILFEKLGNFKHFQ